MIDFVGAGSGAADLITLRGHRLLKEADVIIYAGSLVNPGLLEAAKPDCQIYNSAAMTLEEVIRVMKEAEKKGLHTVRLHTGDPSLYGAIREQIDRLEELGIPWRITPGVSSFCGAAAALGAEYTLPGVSQSVVITRMEGRTPVPEKEKIAAWAAHGATMVIFLSTGLMEGLQEELIRGGYDPGTPAAIVYKATWPEEKVFRCPLKNLAGTARENGIARTALVLVGGFLAGSYERSKLYDPEFTTGFRQGKAPGNKKEE
ncbi:MAG: precorrin-4 C(11)-methyltransferase [Peptococcaceae bacterium]|nr:precorrin-4 C(11)-methyltransferase [Peptococcaceae bacterium]